MSISFVHLRLHTEYSLQDSVVRIPALLERANALKLPALALTDHMNLFASIKFYRAAVISKIKPILGVDAYLENERTPTKPFRLTLLCQTQEGYQRLLQLISKAYQQSETLKMPCIQKVWLQENSTGLIALSGGLYGDIGQALIQNQIEKADTLLNQWNTIFPERFYVELQRMGHPDEPRYIDSVCELSERYDTPVVATHDIRFLDSDDFDAHEARVCIQNGTMLNDINRPRVYNPEYYLKSPEEMQALFSDIPSAVANTVEIAKRCNVTLSFDQVYLPDFPLSDQTHAEHYLVQEAETGLLQKLQLKKDTVLTPHLPESYQQRLQLELTVINSMGFAGYFLIVADFVRWAKSEHIPVGPGRGSGAGSLVAYALGITNVDPLHYQLLFERFLNAERISLPDFDIDFCMEHRDRVITYVMERYGHDAVAQIITFGTMAARAVIRDVGRVLGYPYGLVDSIAKLVPFEVGMTLEKALKRDEQSSYGLKARYNQEDEVRVLLELAKKLEGLVRNAGTHAGGIVIAPTHLTAFTALYYEPEASQAITQLDKDDIETIGLVKFDFLGLRTLTIIDWTIKAINQNNAQSTKDLIDIDTLPLNDSLTFDLLCKGQVTGVFQLESRGIRALLKRLKPNHFGDIVALIALFRPGPLQSGMVDDFIHRKHNATAIQYPHILLEPILKETYGVILYQEQVMQIAQVLAGYTLGAADILRRAMGKKKPQEMAKQRAFFVMGAQKKLIDTGLASHMFDLIEKFAGYGFNKSHSVAYALISYQTAWLKAHYPAQFMASVLSSEIENTDKLSGLIYECRNLGIFVKPPSLRTSQYAFTVNDKNEIEYGLGALKGIGYTAAHHLHEVQKKTGFFKNLFDLCQRVDADKINRRVLDALVDSGAFDDSCDNRAILSGQVELALKAAYQKNIAQKVHQGDLFGMHQEIAWEIPKLSQSWSPIELSKREKAVLGFYFKHHPIKLYKKELETIKVPVLSQYARNTQGTVCFAAWVADFQIKITGKGDRFVVLLLEDTQHRLELRLNQKLYQIYQKDLQKDALLIIEATIYTDKVSQESRLSVQKIWNTVHMREHWQGTLMLQVAEDVPHRTLEKLSKLKTALKPFLGGKCPVVIEYTTLAFKVQLQLGAGWCVQVTDELLNSLQHDMGENAAFVNYS